MHNKLMQTRRSALLTIASTAAVPLLSAQEHAGHGTQDTAAGSVSYEPIFFKKPEYAVVSRVADLIIPRTDTPGAVDAHVPFRIDHEVALSPELQSSFETGLSVLQAEAKNAGAADFTALPEDQQIKILTAMGETPDSPQALFLQNIKNLTIDWYYRSEEGLVKELGFHGNTFNADFPGCTHPEHWPSGVSK